MTDGVKGRLETDLGAAEKELAAAEKIVKRPPAGRRPSEKKADREKVAAAKAKIESMKLSIQQLADGAEVLEAASTEATAEAIVLSSFMSTSRSPESTKQPR